MALLKSVGKGVSTAGKGVAKGSTAAGKGVVKGASAAGGFMKNTVFGPIWRLIKSIGFYLYCCCCLYCCCSLWATGIIQAIVGRVSKTGEALGWSKPSTMTTYIASS